MVDTQVLGACAQKHEGSSPSLGTNNQIKGQKSKIKSRAQKLKLGFTKANCFALARDEKSAANF